jgi:hypothetical protein
MGALPLEEPTEVCREHSADSVCALKITALGMDPCPEATRCLDHLASDFELKTQLKQKCYAPVPATQCTEYDAVMSSLVARVRDLPLAPNPDTAGCAVALVPLSKREQDEYKAVEGHAKLMGVTMGEVLARSQQLEVSDRAAAIHARSELKRMLVDKNWTDEERKWFRCVTDTSLTQDAPMQRHALAEMYGNSLRLKISRLEKFTGVNGGKSSANQKRSADAMLHEADHRPRLAQRHRLQHAVAERLHARLAAGSMASPAHAQRPEAPGEALASRIASHGLEPGVVLMNTRDMARLAKDPTPTPTPGPASATFNNPTDLTRDTDQQLQMTLDALWNGNLLVPCREATKDMGILSVHPLEKAQLARGFRDQRQQLAASLRDIEWLWTQQRTSSSMSGRLGRNGDLVQQLGSGMWNVAERVDWLAAATVFAGAKREEEDPGDAFPGLAPYASDPVEGYKTLFGREPTNARGSVVLRRSRIGAQQEAGASATAAGATPTIRELVQEFALGAYADKMGVGPRQLCCYATPKPDSARKPEFKQLAKRPRTSVKEEAEYIAEMDEILAGEPIEGATVAEVLLKATAQGDRFSEIVSVSEAWDGDLSSMPRGQDMMVDPKFASLLVRVVVSAAAAGIFHGDIKRANILFRVDAAGRLSDLVLTDFDPFFVKLFPALGGSARKAAPCLAVLMVLCFLGEVRCQVPVDGPVLANALGKRIFPVLRDALRPLVDAANPPSELLQSVMPPGVVPGEAPDEDFVRRLFQTVEDEDALKLACCKLVAVPGGASAASTARRRSRSSSAAAAATGEDDNPETNAAALAEEDSKELVGALKQHIENYMLLQKDKEGNVVQPTVPCLGRVNDRTGTSLSACDGVGRPASTAARLMTYAMSGTDLWAKPEAPGRRGKAV